MRYRGFSSILCGLLLVLNVTAEAQRGTSGGQWPNHSGDKGSTKYAPLDQITKNNVRSLTIVWRRPAVANEFRAQHPSVTGTFAADLLPGDANRTNLRYTRGSRDFVTGPRGLPLFKPPYGRITAINLNTGEHVWMKPNGDGPRDHPAIKHLNLPPLGQPGRASPLVTKTLLFIGEGDPINVRTPPGGGGKKFRAYDKASGAMVWETELPAGTTGAPMTYMHNGKQYIVVAIGSAEHPGSSWRWRCASSLMTNLLWRPSACAVRR